MSLGLTKRSRQIRLSSHLSKATLHVLQHLLYWPLSDAYHCSLPARLTQNPPTGADPHLGLPRKRPGPLQGRQQTALPYLGFILVQLLLQTPLLFLQAPVAVHRVLKRSFGFGLLFSSTGKLLRQLSDHTGNLLRQLSDHTLKKRHYTRMQKSVRTRQDERRVYSFVPVSRSVCSCNLNLRNRACHQQASAQLIRVTQSPLYCPENAAEFQHPVVVEGFLSPSQIPE